MRVLFKMTTRSQLLASMLALGADTNQNPIELMEAEGQRALVNSSQTQLPINFRVQAQLETLGFVYGKQVDDLFVEVKFPEGWYIKAAPDHSMYSYLYDNKNRERVSIFYKAAFYDRKASISLSLRFHISKWVHCDEKGNEVEENGTHLKTVIKDCGVTVHTIGIRNQDGQLDDWKKDDKHSKEAKDWLKENYPEHENPLAYWD